jgi:hypothetical protein
MAQYMSFYVYYPVGIPQISRALANKKVLIKWEESLGKIGQKSWTKVLWIVRKR